MFRDRVFRDRSEAHRAAHILALARTISRERLTEGYQLRERIDLADELLGAACASIRSKRRNDPDHRDSPDPTP